MTADQKRWKSMLIGMALIIGFSGAMHVFLIKKKALRTHRYQPQYGKTPENPEEKLLEGGGTVQGEVIAASYDKFFLRVKGQVQPFAVGTLKMPEVGKTITVAFAGGRPPTAVEITDGGSLPVKANGTPSPPAFGR